MATTTNGQEQLANGSMEQQSENPFVRELQKNIRNLRKRLTTTQKADAIIAENPTTSLDDLLKAKKINADQKLQLERKPLLRTQLQQMEDQLEHYKKFDEESSKRFAKERLELEEAHQQAIKQAREEALASAPPQSAPSDARSKLLLLSRFLRAAASRRQQTEDTSEEGKAFEGALLLVYGGNEKAVDTIEKIIEGSDEIVPTTEGEPSGASYKIFQDYISADSDVPEPTEEPTAPTTSNGSDPTIVHAGLTEIDAATDAPFTNTDVPTTTEAPEVSSTQTEAANSAALAQELSSSTTTLGQEGWVEVPRDASETDTGLTATIGAANGTQSWADDVPAATVPVNKVENDGFHEVHHHNNNRGGRGRGEGHRGRGGFRGRVLEGGYRGRGGFRGDRGEGGRGGRGRGRGGEYRGRGRGGAEAAVPTS